MQRRRGLLKSGYKPCARTKLNETKPQRNKEWILYKVKCLPPSSAVVSGPSFLAIIPDVFSMPLPDVIPGQEG
jgi:hypothetical protein